MRSSFACCTLLALLFPFLDVEPFANGQAGQPDKAPARPEIIVTADYPGASARVIEDTVAAVIEQQVNGVARMVHMRSRCTSDGAYKLAITFEPGVDADKAQDLINNRVALAMPVLPDLVQRLGVTTKKAPAYTALLVKVHAPTGKYDALYLSNYASKVRDELSRLPSMNEVSVFGQRESVFRIWLDPQKLVAHRISATDVLNAIQDKAEGAKIDKVVPADNPRFNLTVNLGQLLDVEAIEKMIVKGTLEKPPMVFLRDLAKIEKIELPPQVDVRQNGKSVVMLSVSVVSQANADEVSAAARLKVFELRMRCPEGLDMQTAYDFTPNVKAPHGPKTPQYLLVDVEPPLAYDATQRLTLGDQCATLVSGVDGVKDVVTFVSNQLFHPTCLLVLLTPDIQRARAMQTIRTRLAEKLPGTTVRLRVFTASPEFPWHGGYSVNLALHGPDGVKVRDWAGKVAERLRPSKKLTDCAVSQDARLVPQLHIEIDRKALTKEGLQPADVYNTVELVLGSNAGDRFGNTLLITVPLDGPVRERVEAIKQLKIRAAGGKMLPLAAFVNVKDFTAPLALQRFNGEPMVEITANHAPEAKLAEVRKLCETVAEQARRDLGLPAEYRVTLLE